MKNNFTILFLIVTFFLLGEKTAYSNDLIFDTSEITLSNDGNNIIATDGIVTSSNNKIKLNAKIFNYDKTTEILKARIGTALLVEKKIEIKADKFLYNKNLSTLNAIGNVKIYDSTHNITLISDKVFSFEIEIQRKKQKTDSM